MTISVIDSINKKFGTNAAFRLGDSQSELVPVIPTGSFRLDVALGVGGIPLSRITEIYGPEGSGKSTLCQHLTANCQSMGGNVAFVDVEHALDPNWLEVCGVDIDNLIVSQPDTGEQALDIVEMYVRSKEIDLIIIDSVAALAPKAEIEGEMGDSHMALVARLMSQAMRKLTHAIKESQCAVVFTNQLRKNIGAFMGPGETTTGGEALKYYASVRIDLRRGEQIKDRDEVIGNKVKATVRKNKVAPPFKVANFDIYYNEGISYLSELIELGQEYGFIDKGGAGWYSFMERKVQGTQNFRKLLLEDYQVLQSLEDKIRTELRLPLRRLQNGIS